MAKKQIIAIGGGGYPRDPQYRLEKYIIKQSGKTNPKICFLPQASYESRDYVASFYKTYCTLGAQPDWVSLFNTVHPGWKERLLASDIIFVGGGNTRSMLALWREWGVDVVLKEAYEKGIVLAGVSAGAICWFEQGITDSVWPLGVLDCLGFLEGSACPHYDSEPERRPSYLKFLKDSDVKPGVAIQDFVACHYVDGKLLRAVCARDGKKAFLVSSHEEVEVKTISCSDV